MAHPDNDSPPARGARPARLGKYRIVGHVADGSLTEVLRAQFEGIAGFQRVFAIRRLRGAAATDPAAVREVETRAGEAARLAHSNIVQLLDLGHGDDGVPYVVTEFVDGWSLDTVLARASARGEPVPVPHAAFVGLSLARALDYAHGIEEPVLHDAVAPGNVLVSRGGEVKLADFGLAQAARTIAATHPEAMPDTPTPPERAGAAPSAAADRWGVATTVVALLAGRLPEAGTSVASLRADTPAPLAALLDAARDPDPGARPGLDTLQAAFLDVLAEGPVFTQETLGDWLRALFGEALVTSDEAMPRDEDTGAAPLPLADDDSEELDLGGSAGFALPDAGDDALPSPRADNDPSDPADRTEPRVNEESADDDEDDARTAIGAAAARVVPRASEGTEPSIVHKALTAEDLALDAPLPPQSTPRDAEASPSAAPSRAAAPQAQAITRAPPPPAPRAEPEPSTPPAASGPGWRIAVFLLALGFGLGVAAGFALVPPPAPVAPPGAVLEVRPAGPTPATVTVDGRALTGPMPLAPGDHTVTVDFGDSAWSGAVTLGEGSRHLLVVDPRAAQPADTDTPDK